MSNSALDKRATGAPKPSETHFALPDEEEQTVDPDEFLSLLSDDHARSILKAISDEGRPARTIANHLDLSRATVYRRLNRLENYGHDVEHVDFVPELGKGTGDHPIAR